MTLVYRDGIYPRRRTREEGKDVHVVMLTQRAKIFVQLFNALFVGFYAFFFETLVELSVESNNQHSSLGMFDVM